MADSVPEGFLTKRPQRTNFSGEDNVIKANNLTRGYRMVLLLSDGRRTVYDLLRLTGKPATEMVQILSDLQRLSLIRLE